MGRSPCCDDQDTLKKGPWTPEEDQKLVQYVKKHGHGSWRALPKLAGLNRCGKSCRLRWTNYLRPDIKRGKFSSEEEQTILNLHSILGNKWSAIATHLPGRTDNEIKNFWNTHLKKKLIKMGFDPITHRPRTDLLAGLPQLIALASLREVMDRQPWGEQAIKLQETFQLARVQYLQYLMQSASPMGSNSTSNFLTNGGGADMDPIHLLSSAGPSCSDSMNLFSNSYQLETSTINPSTSMGIAYSSQLVNDDQNLYGSLQDHMHFSCSYQAPMGNEMGQDSRHASFSKGENMVGSPPLIVISSHEKHAAAGNSGGNPGDASSTTSYGGISPSYWPDLLLEDPFIHEINAP